MAPRRLLTLCAAVLALAGCGGADEGTRSADTAPSAAAAAPAEAATRVVVDVRTPEEYASGHVPGALNIDLQSPDFRDRAAGLDPGSRYLVYCRSGNRSAQAAAVMRELGLEVEDGGGLADMTGAGFRTDAT